MTTLGGELVSNHDIFGESLSLSKKELIVVVLKPFG